eukprot:351184-Chlamydomonas_euryale.AAC.2
MQRLRDDGAYLAVISAQLAADLVNQAHAKDDIHMKVSQIEIELGILGHLIHDCPRPIWPISERQRSRRVNLRLMLSCFRYDHLHTWPHAC